MWCYIDIVIINNIVEYKNVNDCDDYDYVDNDNKNNYNSVNNNNDDK